MYFCYCKLSLWFDFHFRKCFQKQNPSVYGITQCSFRSCRKDALAGYAMYLRLFTIFSMFAFALNISQATITYLTCLKSLAIYGNPLDFSTSTVSQIDFEGIIDQFRPDSSPVNTWIVLICAMLLGTSLFKGVSMFA